MKPAPRFNLRIAAVLAVLMIALSSAAVFMLVRGKGEVVLPPPSRQILQVFGNPNDPAWTIDVIGDENFRILSDDTVRMLIDYNGNVGIGTASPSYALDVSGTLRGQNFITTGGHPVNDILLPEDVQNWSITSLKGSVGLDMTDNMEVKVPVTIFEDAEIMGTSATALINGNAFIAYGDCENSNYGTFVIYDSAGNEVKSETVFNSANTASISATTLTNGNVLIAYGDGGNLDHGTFVIYDSAGNQVKAPTEFESVGVFIYISATTLTNGNVLIAYSNADTWYGTFVIYDSAGNEIVAPTVFESSGAFNISATTLTNGNVFIAYSDRGNSWHGAFVIYDSAGNQVKAPTEFESVETVYISATTLTNGNVLIAYSPTDTWYGNFVIYDSAGNQIKAPTVFVSGSVVPISATTLTNGNVLIAYNNRFVIYDSSGNQVQAPTAYESVNLDFISATTLTNGNVLIAYEDVPDYGKFVIYQSSGAYFSGNVGIGDSTPAALLTVGSGDLFQVDSAGKIAAATGITSSGTINFSGLTASKVVFTDASENLTSTGTVGVDQGGTGLTSPGTSGNVLTSDGSAWTSVAPAVPGITHFPFAQSGQYYTVATNALVKSSLAGAANRLDVSPFFPQFDFVVDRFMIQVLTAAAGSLIHVVVYAADETTMLPTDKLLESGDMSGASAATVTWDPASPFTFEAGKVYWVGVHHSSTATLRGINVGALTPLGTPSATGTTNYTLLRRTGVTFGTAPDPFGTGTLTSAVMNEVGMRAQ